TADSLILEVYTMREPHSLPHSLRVLVTATGKAGIPIEHSNAPGRPRARVELPGVAIAKRDIFHTVLALTLAVSLVALPGFSSKSLAARREGISPRASEAQPGLRAGDVSASTTSTAEASNLLSKAAATLPLSFEPNQGQVARASRYFARGAGYSVYLTASGAELDLQIAAPRR